ncbi:MAG TPA: biotin transporter BioY [bacterium]|jgi:biotin transport system substrate-specific component|nr:biotin transporter BioY [bacterium]HPM58144.1 biotin transporter BioY [bacterium]
MRMTTRTLSAMALMTALTAFGSLLRIPFYPVPISLQSLFPLLAGALFSPRAAAGTQAAYLMLGLLGLPLFSQGGGMAYLFQPTFGYLLAMPLTAALVARGVQSLARPPAMRSLALVMALGALFLLVFGTLWLYFSFAWITGRPIPFFKAMGAGLLLFIPGECVKVAAALLVARKFQSFLRS